MTTGKLAGPQCSLRGQSQLPGVRQVGA